MTPWFADSTYSCPFSVTISISVAWYIEYTGRRTKFAPKSRNRTNLLSPSHLWLVLFVIVEILIHLFDDYRFNQTCIKKEKSISPYF